jgi:hypothetical protein
VCLLRGTAWNFKYNSTLCPHSVRTCFLWISGRSQWPRCLRGRSAAERFLGSWVRIPLGALMFVSCTVFVLSGLCLCDRPIPRPEESWLWCVFECGQVKINNLYTCCEQVGRRGKDCEYVRISEQTAIISLYSINWLVFITETECVYCAVRTGFLNVILRSARTVYLCVLCGSHNKQGLSPHTALTDWFL